MSILSVLLTAVAIVEFKYPEGQLAENVPEKLIPIVRHGNQNVTSQIRCIQTNASLTGPNGTHLQIYSEKITMGPGESEAFCRLRITDDHIWEGNSEVVFLKVEPLDDHTIGGRQTTFRASIIDKEDSECCTHTRVRAHAHGAHTQLVSGSQNPVHNHTSSCCFLPTPVPTVQFASPTTREVEPLSHYSVDARNVTLNLTRSGDPTQLLIVEFWTGSGDSDNMGVANVDYQNTSGTVEFPPGVLSANLHVALLANHQRQHDFTFSVHIRKPALASLPLIGAVSRAVVEVSNRNILGPFFPDRPRVTSSRHSQWKEDVLSAYTPLLCVTVSKKGCSKTQAMAFLLSRP